MKKKQSHLNTVILLAILFAGLFLLVYPTAADYWNSFHQSRAISDYAEEVRSIKDDEYDRLLADADAYNRTLPDKPNRYVLTEEERERYNSLLNISGNGIIGYIEIAAIGVSLPIYHGTDEAVMEIAVGHIEGTSLPVGGPDTHAVLSSHRGLQSARLFTDLDKLVEGDEFVIRVLDETLTYEVDQIRIVLPHELDALAFEEGQDLCTLVTCTPYGINTHRLLVRGHRVANGEKAGMARVTADAIQVEPLLAAVFMALPVLLILLIILMIPRRRKRETDDYAEGDYEDLIIDDNEEM